MAKKEVKQSAIPPFPSDNVSQSIKKGSEWNLQWIKSAHDSANREYVGNIENQRSKFKNLRRYAAGKHDIEKFKPQLSSFGNTAYLNLNWNVSTPLPTVVESLTGRFDNQNLKLQVQSNSPLSKTEYDKEFRKIKAQAVLAKNAPQLKQLGVDVESKIKGEVLFDDKEIELHLELNFKDSYTQAMQSVIDFVMGANSFEETRRKLYRDLVVCGRAALRTSFDENYDIKINLTDLTEFITDYALRDDFSDARYMGEYLYPTINDLAATDKFSEKELEDIARRCAGKYNNGPWDNSWGTKYYENYGDAFRPYGRFKIKVLSAEYKSKDIYRYEVIPQKSGGEFLRRIDTLDKKGMMKKPKDPKNEIIEKTVINIYKAKYIVGAERVYDYGLKENQLFEKQINGNYVLQSIFSWCIIAPDIYDMENKSIVEKLIPDADELCLIRLRAQTLIAKMKPQGLAIDIAALSAATNALGEDRLTLRKIQNIYEQTGNLYYSSVREDGEPLTNQLPVKELPEYELAALQQLEAKAANLVQNMSLSSGVPISTVGAPDPDALVGNEKIAAQNRNDSTRYIDTAFKGILKRMGTNVVLMAQDAIENGKKFDDFQMSLGSAVADTLKFSENFSGMQFNIGIKVAPDIVEQEFFKQTIIAAMNSDKIKQSDVYQLLDLAKEDLKLATNYMRVYERKYSKEKMQIAQANLQAQAQTNAQTALAQSQGKIQELTAEYRLKIAYEQAKGQISIMESNTDHQEKMKEISLEGEQKIEQILTAMMGQNMSEDETSEYDSFDLPKESGTRMPSVTPSTQPNV